MKPQQAQTIAQEAADIPRNSREMQARQRDCYIAENRITERINEALAHGFWLYGNRAGRRAGKLSA